jgi:cytochrome c-type biogenesis protein CcmH
VRACGVLAALLPGLACLVALAPDRGDAAPVPSGVRPGAAATVQTAGSRTGPPSAESQAPPTVPEATVHEVAAKLRCVVCQNLSVADSPSEMAAQMRDIVRRRLAAGETPEQVIAYFVERYGEWILLSPAPHGLNLLVWAAPAVAVLVGLAAVTILIRRWTRPARARPEQPVDPALRERVRQELELRR